MYIYILSYISFHIYIYIIGGRRLALAVFEGLLKAFVDIKGLGAQADAHCPAVSCCLAELAEIQPGRRVVQELGDGLSSILVSCPYLYINTRYDTIFDLICIGI